MAAEHRRHARQPGTQGLVRVYRLTALGNRQYVGSCLPLDVSRGGIGAQLDRPVTRGEVLFLQNRFFERYAVVRSCTRLTVGYRVGMQFCEAPRGDKENKRGDLAGRPLRNRS